MGKYKKRRGGEERVYLLYYYLLLNVEEIPEIWHGLGCADREISLQGIVVDG